MKKLLFLAFAFCLALSLQAQEIPFTSVELNDMSLYKPTGKANWQIVGDVNADLNEKEKMSITAGKGVLVNMPDKENRANLISVMEHGDIDIEFDFMMALHSNSGFYLQGRYEIQLLDSWGVKIPYSGDCGGIYQRRKLPEYIMYEGHAPRQNACLAPGLWQHLQISFQAPRFDVSGKKITNAKVLKISMNGVVLHENVELSGPTGGPISEQEAALGPFMIQGDHGAVAFRNFKYKSYDKTAATLSNHQYKVYTGEFKTLAKIPTDWSTVKLAKQGTAPELTWEVSPNPNNFALVYNSTFKAPNTGKYLFSFAHGGAGRLRIDGKDVVAEAWAMPQNKRMGMVELSAGDHTLEAVVSKVDGWVNPALGIAVEGPGFRSTPLNSVSSMLAAPPTDPIMVQANENTILRSFMDYFKDGKRVKRLVHSVNVGTTDKLHYTYNMDKASIAQIWKGGFLDTTPMWDNRGDGSSRPMGASIWLGDLPAIGLAAENQLLSDTLATDSGYKPMGYDVDAAGLPTFRFQAYGATVEDAMRVEDKYYTRELKIKNEGKKDLICLLAQDAKIVQVADNLFMVGDKSYFVKVLEAPESKASIISDGTKSQLIVPVKGTKIKYAVMW